MRLTFQTAKELSPSRRRAALTGLVVLAALLIVAEYYTHVLELRPLAFFLVLGAAALGSLRFSVGYAIVVPMLIIFAQALGQAVPFSGAVFFNAALAGTVTVCIPLLVNYVRRGAEIRERLTLQLRESQNERVRLEEKESARLALERAEATYEAIGDAIPFGVWRTDENGKLTYVSQSYLDICGMTFEELAHGGWSRVVPRHDAERFLERWKSKDEKSDFWEGEYHIKGVDGNVYVILSRGARLRDESGNTTGWSGVSLDITERKRATEAFAVLAEAGRELILSLDPIGILERIAKICVPRIADWAAFDIVHDDGELRSAVVMHADAEKADLARELRAYPTDPNSPRGAWAVVRSGKSELYPSIDPKLLEEGAQDARHLELIRSLGMQSAMIVPLIAREKVIGTLTLITAESGRHFDEHDLELIQVLGVRTALAFENARHYARELRVADTLQRASLPPALPHVPGIRINATYLPGATDSEIGGDWYDAFTLPDGKIGLTIGDVAGKGLRAAVAMGMVRQLLRGAALDGLSPAQALKRVNRHLCHEVAGMVTAVAATLDPADGMLRYASAGHPPIIIAARDREVRRLYASGVPLGLFPEVSYEEREAQLRLGDLVVFYTDGLIEHHRDIASGERTLSEAIQNEAVGESPNPAVSIQHRVFSGRPNDDVAIMTVGISPAPLDHLDVEAPAVPASARILRQAVRRLAIGVGLSDERTFPLLVAAGEAVSNAIEHAYGVGEGTVRVRGFRRDGRLIVEVSDTGGWRPRREEGRGRGLPLIRSIVDAADVHTGESGTTVRLEIELERAEAV